MMLLVEWCGASTPSFGYAPPRREASVKNRSLSVSTLRDVVSRWKGSCLERLHLVQVVFGTS